MKDLFPYIYGTLGAEAAFADFTHNDLLKVYPDGEAPDLTTPFITVEVNPGPEHRLTKWTVQEVIFAIYGPVTGWSTLWDIANDLIDTFRDRECFVKGATKLPYELIGPAMVDKARNPVTEQAVVSVGLRFGLLG